MTVQRGHISPRVRHGRIAARLLAAGRDMRSEPGRPSEVTWRTVCDELEHVLDAGFVAGEIYIRVMDCWRQLPPGSPRRDRWGLVAASIEIVLEMDAAAAA